MSFWNERDERKVPFAFVHKNAFISVATRLRFPAFDSGSPRAGVASSRASGVGSPLAAFAGLASGGAGSAGSVSPASPGRVSTVFATLCPAPPAPAPSGALRTSMRFL
jgi:hypothetical protein